MSIRKRVFKAVRRHDRLAKPAARAMYHLGLYDRKAVDEEAAALAGGRHGREISDLKRDIVLCQKCLRIDPHEYRLFGFEGRSEEERRQFIGFTERRDIVDELIRGRKSWRILLDKYKAYETFKAWYRRDAAEIDGEKSRPGFEAFAGKHRTFIVKPRDGEKGKDVSLITLEQGDLTGGKVFDELLSQGPWIAEEIVSQDPRMAAFHPASINTVRVMTYCEDDEVKVLFSLVRMGRGGAVVDNASAGGIIAAVDALTGEIVTPGFTETARETFAIHPDTGVPITGSRIPEWERLLGTVDEIARILPDQKLTGWDLALTDRGWAMIEGNHEASFTGYQLCTGQGVRPLIEKTVGEAVMTAVR